MSILTLIKKNFVLLIRSRGSALTIILGPMLLVILAGMAFDNTNAYNVKIGVTTPQQTPLIKEFLNSLTDTKFKLQTFNDEQSCSDAVKSGEVQACIAFSAAFDGANPNNAITFYVDYSRINLVSMIIETLSRHITIRSTELSKNMASTLLGALDTVRKTVQDKKALAVNLATQNDAMSKITIQTQQQLGQIDVTVDVDSFGASAITSSHEEFNKQWANFSETASTQLTEIIISMARIKNQINQSNFSDSEKYNLSLAVTSVIKNATSVRTELATTQIDFNSHILKLNSTLQGMLNVISSTKDKLDTATVSLRSTSQQMGILKQQIDASLVNIIALQEAINSIDGAINAISISDAGTVAQPVKTSVKPVSAQRSYLNYLFPSLLIVVLMFTGILLAPLLLLVEKHSQAGFRNYMAPIPQWMFSLSIFLTTAIILAFQTLLIIIIATGMFTIDIGSIPSLIGLFMIIIAVFTLLGMLIGVLFQTEESSTLAAVITGSVLLFLSDILIPIETMPESVSAIAKYNPVVIGSNLLRKVLLFDGTLNTDALYLMLYSVIMIVVIVFFDSRLKQNLMLKKIKKVQ